MTYTTGHEVVANGATKTIELAKGIYVHGIYLAGPLFDPATYKVQVGLKEKDKLNSIISVCGYAPTITNVNIFVQDAVLQLYNGSAAQCDINYTIEFSKRGKMQ